MQQSFALGHGLLTMERRCLDPLPREDVQTPRGTVGCGSLVVKF
jgi:hypothetical protein